MRPWKDAQRRFRAKKASILRRRSVIPNNFPRQLSWYCVILSGFTPFPEDRYRFCGWAYSQPVDLTGFEGSWVTVEYLGPP